MEGIGRLFSFFWDQILLDNNENRESSLKIRKYKFEFNYRLCVPKKVLDSVNLVKLPGKDFIAVLPKHDNECLSTQIDCFDIAMTIGKISITAVDCYDILGPRFKTHEIHKVLSQPRDNAQNKKP